MNIEGLKEQARRHEHVDGGPDERREVRPHRVAEHQAKLGKLVGGLSGREEPPVLQQVDVDVQTQAHATG